MINCNRIIKNNGTSKILNLLNEADDSKFVTRKWNLVNDQWNANYDIGNEIIYNKEVSNLILVISMILLARDDIIITAHNNPTPVALVQVIIRQLEVIVLFKRWSH